MSKFLLFSILSLTSFHAYGQESPPQTVVKSFQSKFSNAQDVKWAMEGQNEWEAEFKMNGESISATFDKAGKWLETEKEMKKADLPAEVFKSLALRFEGFEIEEVESIETPDFKGYEASLEKRETEVEVLIDKSGEISIKKVKVEDDEDNYHEDKGDEDRD